MPDPGRPKRRSPFDPSWTRGAVAAAVGLAALLALAWLLAIDGPRERPSPTLDPRAPFPELAPRATALGADASASSSAPGEAAGAAADPFTAALRRRMARARTLSAPGWSSAGNPATPSPSPSSGPDSSPNSSRAPVQALPLGGGLVAELPAPGAQGAAGGTWHWSSAGWATLAVRRSAGGEPTALLYAEPFTPLYVARPTAELLRFRLTVLPVTAEELPLVGGLWSALRDGGGAGGLGRRIGVGQLLATATSGRGLGFDPGEDAFSGMRWVGRNEHGILLRLGRFTGSRQEQRPLPAALASRLSAAGRGGRAGAPGRGAARVPAYLVVGSAAAPGEGFGAHLALICASNPDCAAAAELATLLASIRPADRGRLERLAEGAEEPFDTLARAAGLDLSRPAPSPRARPPASSP